MSQRLPPRVLAALVLQTVIAAGTHLASKRATGSFDVPTLVTLRVTMAAVAFAVVLRVMGVGLPPRRALPWLALFSFITGPLNQGLASYGLSRSLASHGGLLYALTPIGVYLVALALGRERGSPRRLFGILLALSGVVLLLLERGLAAAMGPLVGDLFILAAVGCWVAWTVESRAFAKEYGGVETAGWCIVGGGLWLLPALPWVLSRPGLADVDPVGWGSLAYLVVLSSVVAYAAWNYALARVESSRVAVFSNLQPVGTAVAAWALLGEPLGWGVAVSLVLVLGGVRLAQRG